MIEELERRIPGEPRQLYFTARGKSRPTGTAEWFQSIPLRRTMDYGLLRFLCAAEFAGATQVVG